MAEITSSGSVIAANGTNHAPSVNRPRTLLATSVARRLLPVPGGPVIVTSWRCSTSPAIVRTSAARPMKLVVASARLPGTSSRARASR